MSCYYGLRSQLLLVLVCGTLLSWFAPAAGAAHPTAPHLLPKETLAYIRISDMPELREKFKQTMLGRIGADEKIKPLISQLYGSAATAFEQINEQGGAGLDEILAIPQGEVCLAVVVPATGEVLAIRSQSREDFKIEVRVDENISYYL